MKTVYFQRGLYLAAAIALACIAMTIPNKTFAQSVGTYLESSTGNTKNAQGVVIISGTVAATVSAPSTDTNSVAFGTNVNSQNLVFNSTNWARMRGDANGTVVMPGLVTTWWRYVPPTGGYLNSTAGVVVRAATGGVNAYIWGGECYSDPLATATEIELRDGAAGTVMWRVKVPTTGWTTGFDINFNPPLRGSTNTLVEFAGVTASATGAIYCNWRGTTGS